MNCSKCGAAGADTYTPDGDLVCKRCFYADDTKRKDDEATTALIWGGYVGIIAGTLGIVAGAAVGLRFKYLYVACALGIAAGIASLREGRERKRRLG